MSALAVTDAEFEKWASVQGLRLPRRDFPGSSRLGQYCADDTQLAWEAWRAAAELRKGEAVPDQPDIALLASMATCLNHGFGLDNVTSQNRQLASMRKLWEEVMGRGYYRPEHRDRYTAMISAPAPAGADEGETDG